MAAIHLTHGAFEKVTQRPGIVLLDFWAPWCAPCRSFAPIFEAVSERHPDITFAQVNTEDEQRLAAEWGIRSIPTVMAFKDGVPVFEQPGMLPAPALEKLVSQLRALDMEQVREELRRSAAAAEVRS
jgi:thioredoxin 1